MVKFKAGDRVLRTGKDTVLIMTGASYIVDRVSVVGQDISLVGVEDQWYTVLDFVLSVPSKDTSIKVVQVSAKKRKLLAGVMRDLLEELAENQRVVAQQHDLCIKAGMVVELSGDILDTSATITYNAPTEIF